MIDGVVGKAVLEMVCTGRGTHTERRLLAVVLDRYVPDVGLMPGISAVVDRQAASNGAPVKTPGIGKATGRRELTVIPGCPSCGRGEQWRADARLIQQLRDVAAAHAVGTIPEPYLRVDMSVHTNSRT